MRLRAIGPADYEQISAINEAGRPGVTGADPREIGRLVGLAALPLAAVDEAGDVSGFLIALAPGVDYDSENYRWFMERGTDFLYVDRIAIAPGRRGAGIGEALYREVFRVAAEEGRTEVTCEVSTDPPNPGSLRFHGRLGFERVGELVVRGGEYEVALMARPVGG